MRAAIITVSSSRGVEDDRGGPALTSFATALGAEIAGAEIVPDDQLQIAARLIEWSDLGVELVLTTGGTGFAPSDVTPEATRTVIEREAMRRASAAHTPHWMLSRGIAGIRGRSLIINFPGSPKSIAEAGAGIADALPHALTLLGGQPSDHG